MIDHVVIGRAVHEATGFDKESLNRSMEMTVPTMGSSTDFKLWKRNFLTFMPLKVAYLIPQLAIGKSDVCMDEAAQNCAYVLLLHDAIENIRVDKAGRCVSAARFDCATADGDILCGRLDGRSFARSLSMLNKLMLRQRPG
jgi:hypothetical protein